MLKKKWLAVPILATAMLASSARADDGVNTAVGAVVGALIGNSISGHHGAVVGGVLGAVVGASASNYNQGYYDRGGYATTSGYSGYAQPQAYYQSPPTYYQPAPVYYRPAPVYQPSTIAIGSSYHDRYPYGRRGDDGEYRTPSYRDHEQRGDGGRDGHGDRDDHRSDARLVGYSHRG